MRFDEFTAELEREAHAEGPAAVAELEALRRAFVMERAAFSSQAGDRPHQAAEQRRPAASIRAD